MRCRENEAEPMIETARPGVFKQNRMKLHDDGLAESDEAMDEAVVNHKVNKQSTTTASTSLAYTTAEGRGGEERENGEEGEEIQLLMMGREAMARGKGTTRREKPLLRGVSHQVACFVALVSGIVLMFKAPNEKAMVSAGVFALSLTTLFGKRFPSPTTITLDLFFFSCDLLS